MELIRKTIKVGNSAGVLLPKKLLGSEVKIIVVKRPVNIRKLVFKLLDQNLEHHLEDVRGIYIMSKTEKPIEKPIEVLVISSGINETIDDEKIKINIVPFSIIKRDIKTKPVLRAKLANAKTILNKGLLIELKKEIKGMMF